MSLAALMENSLGLFFSDLLSINTAGDIQIRISLLL